MTTPTALLLYPVLAPEEAASPVVTASVVDGNPIVAKPAKMPGWTFLTLKLRPIDEFREGANLSLIATRLEPKQTAFIEGSQGGYLQKIRARTHSWLLAGGDSGLADYRMDNYRAMEKQATVPGREWGLPRKAGKEDAAPARTTMARGGRGKDKGRRRQRRDRYLVLVAPDGSSLAMLPRSRQARVIAEAGYPAPSGWHFVWRNMEPPGDNRPIMRRLVCMPGYGVGVVPFELFLKGKNPLFADTATKVTPTNGS